MEFKLPDIGEGVHEGEIVKWLVKAGDTIQADQPMVEVMTDKATVEIPSPVSGTVEALFAKEGDTVEVGKAIVRIAEAGKAASAPAPAATAAATAPKAEAKAAPAAKTAAPATAARAQESGGAGRGSATVAFAEEPELPFHVLATPATRKLARELNVSLRSVTGTGPHGRITKDDVHAASNGGGRATGTAAAREPMASSTGAAPRRETPVVARGELKRIPLRGVRRKIAEAMAHAKHTAAHFTYVEEVDMTAVVKLRASAAEEAKKKGIKLTFLPFILKALVPTLKEFPYLNSSLDDAAQEIILKGDYNIGIATDTPQGLMVPVVKAEVGVGARAGNRRHHRARALGQEHPGRSHRRHVHGDERRLHRWRVRDAGHQPPGSGDSRRERHPETARRRRRPNRHPRHDVPLDVRRSPYRRRRRCGSFHESVGLFLVGADAARIRLKECLR
jgi:pyruvate dehydrogenase E2 component (dihydrolipoamide acetyltransferase)